MIYEADQRISGRMWKPGDINISFDPEYPGNRYDMFGGVEYEIDLSKPKGERVDVDEGY